MTFNSLLNVFLNRNIIECFIFPRILGVMKTCIYIPPVHLEWVSIIYGFYLFAGGASVYHLRIMESICNRCGHTLQPHVLNHCAAQPECAMRRSGNRNPPKAWSGMAVFVLEEQRRTSSSANAVRLV